MVVVVSLGHAVLKKSRTLVFLSEADPFFVEVWASSIFLPHENRAAFPFLSIISAWNPQIGYFRS